MKTLFYMKKVVSSPSSARALEFEGNGNKEELKKGSRGE
jgi:hypothetical protein